MPTDTTVNSLVINKLTKAQYENIQNPSDTELYLIPDEIDTSPTSGSSNCVTSGGVYTALQDKANKSEMSVVAGTGNDSDKTTITLKTETSATVLTSHQDITGKADKVSNATNGNFASLDSNGNLVDSGYSAGDFGGTSTSGNSKVFYGTCSEAGATKTVTCSDFTSSDLVDGVMVIVKFGATNTGAVASLTLNVNGTGAYPIKKIYATSSSNAGIKDLAQAGELCENSIIPFVFTGSYWLISGVDVNINTTYNLNYSYDAGQYKAGSGTYAVTRYSLLLQKADGTWEKTTSTGSTYSTGTSKSVNTNGFLLNQIVYYNTTTAKANGALLATNTCYRKAASVNLQYSTNCGSSPGWAIGDYIYLVGTMHSDGLFYLDTTTWWSNALPSTNDGKLYIRLGLVLENNTTDHLPTTNISFFDNRPIFYHDGTRVCEFMYSDNLAEKTYVNSSISGKADKVSSATSGNFAGLDSNGNLTDSGISSSNIVQKSNTTGLLKNDGTIDTSTYLTSHQDISGKADKSEMSVVAGTGNDSDKTTITLKTGTSATVLTSHQDITGKQDTINDLSTIRTGAGLGATAYQLPSGGIPASDIASGVIPTVPTNVSSFTNDANYVTSNNTITIYSGSSAPSGSLGSNGDIYIQTT